MIVEKIVTEKQRVCDSCEINLEGLHNSIKIYSIDLCSTCASKILENLNIPEEKAISWVKTLREKILTNENLRRDITDIFSKPEDTTRYIHKDNKPPYSTSIDEAKFKTNGIEKMIPVTSVENNLKVPSKTVSSLTNLGDL